MNVNFGREGKRPTVGCDTVVFDVSGETDRILLIRRGKDPYKGEWAFPGGFLEWDESCEQGAARELEEETGLKGLELKQIGAFSKPGRDPRGTIVSVAFMAVITEKMHAQGGDDAAEAQWFDLNNLPKLAFDHSDILKTAVKMLRT